MRPACAHASKALRPSLCTVARAAWRAHRGAWGKVRRAERRDRLAGEAGEHLQGDEPHPPTAKALARGNGAPRCQCRVPGCARRRGSPVPAMTVPAVTGQRVLPRVQPTRRPWTWLLGSAQRGQAMPPAVAPPMRPRLAPPSRNAARTVRPSDPAGSPASPRAPGAELPRSQPDQGTRAGRPDDKRVSNGLSLSASLGVARTVPLSFLGQWNSSERRAQTCCSYK